MINTTITFIGEHAIDPKDRMFILFDESATQGLQDFSIIHRFDNDQRPNLKVGKVCQFGNQTYTITYVGALAEKNFAGFGHMAVVFQDVPESDPLKNAIYVTPTTLPKVTEGMKISFN